MAYERATARYRQWYAKLLRFYPKPYRERFGEGMEQTFNDLCLEQYKTGGGLFGLVLWTFADTFAGIIKEGVKFMTPTFKKNVGAILWVITGIATAGTALLVKGSEYENAWLWVFCIGMVLSAVWEAYYNYKKNKDKDK